MEGITPGTVWAMVAAVAAGVVLLSNAAEKVVKVWKAAKAPNAKQDERLEALEDWRRTVDDRLSKDHQRLSDIEEGDRAVQHALLALLDHGIDGNNTKQMQDAKKLLQEHLINK